MVIINLTIVVYFILIWLINIYKIEAILIGVFRELLTLPFFIAQIVFLVLTIKHWIKHNKNLLVIISTVPLTICAIITVSSFFN